VPVCLFVRLSVVLGVVVPVPNDNWLCVPLCVFFLGMDLDETAHLSPSQNRRPFNDEGSLPEEEQPITIITTGRDYLPDV